MRERTVVTIIPKMTVPARDRLSTDDTYDSHHNGAIVSTHALTTLKILAPPKQSQRKEMARNMSSRTKAERNEYSTRTESTSHVAGNPIRIPPIIH